MDSLDKVRQIRAALPRSPRRCEVHRAQLASDMPRYAHRLLILLASLGISGCSDPDASAGASTTNTTGDTASVGSDTSTGSDSEGDEIDGPRYFLVLHCEPSPPEVIAEHYTYLQEAVAKADALHMHLTIMLTAQWADFIVADADRKAEVTQWMAGGHEIAGHHHGIWHPGRWDGYTDFPDDVPASRPEPYLGDLDAYTESLRAINPEIQSGCMNDERDKNELPDAIVIDTCSGFSTNGEEGVWSLFDELSTRGVNEYMNVGLVNGVERRWLAHSTVFSPEEATGASAAMATMDSGVYGVVTHAVPAQVGGLYTFMDWVAEKDPQGERSVTLIEAANLGLPEHVLTEEELVVRPPVPSQCNDGICGEAEQANPDLCPQDCN